MTKALQALIAPQRKLEDAAQLATVIDSPEAIRVLAAWPATRKAWKKAAGKAPASSGPRWEWLWRGAKIDHDSLARTARLAADQAMAMLRVLVAARVVYPDGTISKHAAQLVGSYVEKRLAQHAPSAKSKERKERKASGYKDGPRSRACPTCNVKAGERCKMPSGKHYTKPFHHAARKGTE